MLKILAVAVSILTTALAGKAAVADDRPFSAQDVMSVCVAAAHDPELVKTIFESQGWIELSHDQRSVTAQDLSIAYIGARYVHPTPVHGTSVGIEYWQEAWPVVSKHIAKRLNEETAAVYSHASSGATLLIEASWSKQLTGLSCLLAVPNSELKRSSYFPKLRQPTAPAVSFTEGEWFFSEIIRSKFSVRSSSLDVDAIGAALGITNTIGAAFVSDTEHPSWTLTP